jgi:hypothetical protein
MGCLHTRGDGSEPLKSAAPEASRLFLDKGPSRRVRRSDLCKLQHLRLPSEEDFLEAP